MKRRSKLSALLLTGAMLLTSCGDNPGTKSAESNATSRIKEMDKVLKELSTPEALKNDPAATLPLNRDLAAKMTFAEPDVIIALIKKGATPEAKNRYGLPVIFMAAERGDVTILEALAKAGADVNSKIGTTHNTDGIGYTGTADGTPMSYAAAKGKIEALQFLLDHKADINGAGPEGTTPLMSAAQLLQLEAVQWLVKNGSTAGKEKALGLASMFINPDEKTKQIIQLLK